MDPRQAIKSFKDYCDRYAISFSDGSAVIVTRLGGGWVKERFLFEKSEDIDVFQTASLMYPYEAKHQFVILREFTDFHASRNSAEVDSRFFKSDQSRHIHAYRYDNDFWIPIKRVHQSIYPQTTAAILGVAPWYDCIQSEGDKTTYIHQCTHGEDILCNRVMANVEVASLCSDISFDVVLVNYPIFKKVKIVKVLRDLTGLSLGDAVTFANSLPATIMRGVSKTDAEAAKIAFEAEGADVDIV